MRANPARQLRGFGWFVVLLLAFSALAAAQSSAPHRPSRSGPPIADAGPDLSAHVFEAVTVDGSSSHDSAAGEGSAEQGLIVFRWSIVQAPPGSAAQIDTASPAPVLRPDVPGAYLLQLVVTGTDGTASLPAQTTVTAYAGNAAPVAQADSPRHVALGTAIEIDARRSHDPDGDALAFTWSFASVPLRSTLTDRDMFAAQSAVARFTPDVEGRYVVTLRAGDGGFTTEARAVVTAFSGNVPPIADARAALVGSGILLDGSASQDPDYAPQSLRYAWSLVARPAGSTSTREDMRDADAAQASFEPDADGAYVFRLQVSDGERRDAGNVLVHFARATATDTSDDASAAGRVVAPREGGSAKTRPTPERGIAHLRLNVQPRSLRVTAGGQGVYGVTLVEGQAAKGPKAAHGRGPAKSPGGGAGLEATLHVKGLPPGASAQFAETVLAPGDHTTLTVTTAATTPAGVHTLRLTAIPRGRMVAVTRVATVSLRVRAPDLGEGAGTPVACGSADLSKLARSVYVSPTGTDRAGCGATPAAACATIQRGIDRCSGTGCGVLVRYGRYRTTATVDLKDGVSVYGGCTFAPVANPHYRTVIDASPAPGSPAVSAASINSATTVSGLVVVGKDETAKGTASIAMRVSASRGLVLQNATLAAGRGGDGATGSTTPAGTGGDGQQGFGNSGGTGGPSCPSNHPSAAGDGGRGGDVLQYALKFPNFCFITCPCGYPNAADSVGKSGSASGSVRGARGGGQAFGGDYCTGPAGSAEYPFAGRSGGAGSIGACATQGGRPSTDVFGLPDGQTGRWLPGAGGAGGTGNVGSGGGGGSGGGYCVGFRDGLHPEGVTGNPGSGAGGGGCGGNGGNGGQQGGASIALVLVNATVPGIAQSSLIPGPGGRGGNGGTGGQGGSGGAGIAGYPAGPTTVGSYQCPGPSGAGGPGGQGGAGGGGAGGNGGPSVGVFLLSGSPNPGTPGIYAGLPGIPGAKGPGGKNPAQRRVSPCTAADGHNGMLGGFGLVVDPTLPARNFVLPGQSLARAQNRVSADGSVELIMRTDGNFCLYQRGAYRWCSDQAGLGDADDVSMQTDGNLCLSTAGNNPTCSNTAGHPGAYLVVQDDGRAIIYDGATALWTIP